MSTVTDFSALDTKTPAEAGVVISLDDPRTNEPAICPDGAPMTITAMGVDADKVIQTSRKIADRRLDRMRKGRETDLDADSLNKERIAVLAAATLAWHLPPVDGEDLPCTEANAKKLYSDPRFPWIVEQLDRKLGDRTRFFESKSSN